MKKVMVFGAFDGFHPGHLDFLRQAKKHGDYLVVSVGTDKNVEKIKGKKPLFRQDERLEIVSQLKIANRAILGTESDFYIHIAKNKPQVICLGYDQWVSKGEVEKELLKVGLKNTKVIRLKPFRNLRAKSTMLKKDSVGI